MSFLIACANVAAFLLGRSSARSHETSLRIALGASRQQLIRQLLADSIVISVFGGALALLLAHWTSRVIPALLFAEDAERLAFAPDPGSILTACATGVALTLISGLLPVLFIRDDRPADVLRRESAGPSPAIRRIRSALVIGQMACCALLMVSTGALRESFRQSLKTAAGERLGQPILATVEADPRVGIRYYERVGSSAKSIPGITRVEWAGQIPGGQPSLRRFRIEPPGLPTREVALDIDWLTPKSRPPALSAGRMFGLRDRACPSGILNQEAAQLLSASIGRTLEDAGGRRVEVIGVVDGPKSVPTVYYYADAPTSRVARAPFRIAMPTDLAKAELDVNVVSPGYFEAMGASLVTGRMFLPGGCRTGIVNQEASERYFAGKPLGSAVIDEAGNRTEIVGVVQAAPLGAFQPPTDAAIYFPMGQDEARVMYAILGARDASDALLEHVRRTIEAVDGKGDLPIVVKTLEMHLVQTALAPLRIATVMATASATTALLLSMLGLSSALSDAARRRRRELALRIALGAQARHILMVVLNEGVWIAAIGATIGIGGAFMVSRFLAPITLTASLGAPLALAAAVIIAGILPARRVWRTNPVALLRDS